MAPRQFVVQLLLVILAVFVNVVHSNVIGIDFASDAMKVAIVQPGTPLEIGKSLSPHRCASPRVTASSHATLFFQSPTFSPSERHPPALRFTRESACLARMRTL
jgi:hypothetical protein